MRLFIQLVILIVVNSVSCISPISKPVVEAHTSHHHPHHESQRTVEDKVLNLKQSEKNNPKIVIIKSGYVQSTNKQPSIPQRTRNLNVDQRNAPYLTDQRSGFLSKSLTHLIGDKVKPKTIIMKNDPKIVTINGRPKDETKTRNHNNTETGKMINATFHKSGLDVQNSSNGFRNSYQAQLIEGKITPSHELQKGHSKLIILKGRTKKPPHTQKSLQQNSRASFYAAVKSSGYDKHVPRFGTRRTYLLRKRGEDRILKKGGKVHNAKPVTSERGLNELSVTHTSSAMKNHVDSAVDRAGPDASKMSSDFRPPKTSDLNTTYTYIIKHAPNMPGYIENITKSKEVNSNFQRPTTKHVNASISEADHDTIDSPSKFQHLYRPHLDTSKKSSKMIIMKNDPKIVTIKGRPTEETKTRKQIYNETGKMINATLQKSGLNVQNSSKDFRNSYQAQLIKGNATPSHELQNGDSKLIILKDGAKKPPNTQKSLQQNSRAPFYAAVKSSGYDKHFPRIGSRRTYLLRKRGEDRILKKGGKVHNAKPVTSERGLNELSSAMKNRVDSDNFKRPTTEQAYTSINEANHDTIDSRSKYQYLYLPNLDKSEKRSKTISKKINSKIIILKDGSLVPLNASSLKNHETNIDAAKEKVGTNLLEPVQNLRDKMKRNNKWKHRKKMVIVQLRQKEPSNIPMLNKGKRNYHKYADIKVIRSKNDNSKLGYRQLYNFQKLERNLNTEKPLTDKLKVDNLAVTETTSNPIYSQLGQRKKILMKRKDKIIGPNTYILRKGVSGQRHSPLPSPEKGRRYKHTYIKSAGLNTYRTSLGYQYPYSANNKKQGVISSLIEKNNKTLQYRVSNNKALGIVRVNGSLSLIGNPLKHNNYSKGLTGINNNTEFGKITATEKLFPMKQEADSHKQSAFLPRLNSLSKVLEMSYQPNNQKLISKAKSTTEAEPSANAFIIQQQNQTNQSFKGTSTRYTNDNTTNYVSSTVPVVQSTHVNGILKQSRTQLFTTTSSNDVLSRQNKSIRNLKVKSDEEDGSTIQSYVHLILNSLWDAQESNYKPISQGFISNTKPALLEIPRRSFSQDESLLKELKNNQNVINTTEQLFPEATSLLNNSENSLLSDDSIKQRITSESSLIDPVELRTPPTSTIKNITLLQAESSEHGLLANTSIKNVSKKTGLINPVDLNDLEVSTINNTIIETVFPSDHSILPDALSSQSYNLTKEQDLMKNSTVTNWINQQISYSENDILLAAFSNQSIKHTTELNPTVASVINQQYPVSENDLSDNSTRRRITSKLSLMDHGSVEHKAKPTTTLKNITMLHANSSEHGFLANSSIRHHVSTKSGLIDTVKLNNPEVSTINNMIIRPMSRSEQNKFLYAIKSQILKHTTGVNHLKNFTVTSVINQQVPNSENDFLSNVSTRQQIKRKPGLKVLKLNDFEASMVINTLNDTERRQIADPYNHTSLIKQRFDQDKTENDIHFDSQTQFGRSELPVQRRRNIGKSALQPKSKSRFGPLIEDLGQKQSNNKKGLIIMTEQFQGIFPKYNLSVNLEHPEQIQSMLNNNIKKHKVDQHVLNTLPNPNVKNVKNGSSFTMHFDYQSDLFMPKTKIISKPFANHKTLQPRSKFEFGSLVETFPQQQSDNKKGLDRMTEPPLQQPYSVNSENGISIKTNNNLKRDTVMKELISRRVINQAPQPIGLLSTVLVKQNNNAHKDRNMVTDSVSQTASSIVDAQDIQLKSSASNRGTIQQAPFITIHPNLQPTPSKYSSNSLSSKHQNMSSWLNTFAGSKQQSTGQQDFNGMTTHIAKQPHSENELTSQVQNVQSLLKALTDNKITGKQVPTGILKRNLSSTPSDNGFNSLSGTHQNLSSFLSILARAPQQNSVQQGLNGITNQIVQQAQSTNDVTVQAATQTQDIQSLLKALAGNRGNGKQGFGQQVSKSLTNHKNQQATSENYLAMQTATQTQNIQSLLKALARKQGTVQHDSVSTLNSKDQQTPLVNGFTSTIGTHPNIDSLLSAVKAGQQDFDKQGLNGVSDLINKTPTLDGFNFTSGMRSQAAPLVKAFSNQHTRRSKSRNSMREPLLRQAPLSNGLVKQDITPHNINSLLKYLAIQQSIGKESLSGLTRDTIQKWPTNTLTAQSDSKQNMDSLLQNLAKQRSSGRHGLNGIDSLFVQQRPVADSLNVQYGAQNSLSLLLNTLKLLRSIAKQGLNRHTKPKSSTLLNSLTKQVGTQLQLGSLLNALRRQQSSRLQSGIGISKPLVQHAPLLNSLILQDGTQPKHGSLLNTLARHHTTGNDQQGLSGTAERNIQRTPIVTDSSTRVGTQQILSSLLKALSAPPAVSSNRAGLI